MEIASEIYSWLANLQIKQKTIAAKIVAGAYQFELPHPTQGAVSVKQAVRDNELFSCHGVALRSRGQDGHGATLDVFDAGGIYDPLDGRVQGEHYSTTHFALLAAILYQETKEPQYLESAKQAIEFHLRTSPTEYAPFANWMYHWDFQNYAFVLTYRLLRETLTAAELQRWQKGLHSWRTNYKNKLTNWAAMRAWAFAERNMLFGKPLDQFKVKWNLRYVDKARHADGCFDDNANLSRPIQYHVFTVALVHRLLLLQENNNLRKWFDSGIEYLLPFIDPDAEFNYLGRGQRQIFGYAAAIYALEAAYQFERDDELLRKASGVFEFLLRYQEDRHFPLVLNEQPDEKRSGWYDYHHLTVYNAFLGAWLGLTHLLKNPKAEGQKENTRFFWFTGDTQTAIVSRDNYFAAFYGGLPEYLCEAGITPHHLWWKNLGLLFSCPGGASAERFGNYYPAENEKNLFAPIAKGDGKWFLPAYRASGLFECGKDHLNMRYNYGPFSVERMIKFDEAELFFEDRIYFHADATFDEFRFFNFPVAASHLNVEVVDQNGLKITGAEGSISLEIHGGCDFPIEELERIYTANGLVHLLVKREQPFRAKKGDEKVVSFTFVSNETGENAQPVGAATRVGELPSRKPTFNKPIRMDSK